MDFSLTDDEQLLRANVRAFCRAEVAEQAKQWDEDERLPEHILRKVADMGLMGMQVPEQYGGAGVSAVASACVIEELAATDGSLALTVASHNALCTGHIFLAGNEQQRHKYLPELCSGRALGAWGLTEPGSGSDAAGARTTAVRRGERWILNGSKTFITQGSIGKYAVVIASTDPSKKQHGLTAFVLERGMPGFSVGKKIEKLGMRASDTVELVFEDVEVPLENQLGEQNRGFVDTLQILDRGRIGIAALACGLGRGAMDASIAYARERKQFGQPLAAFQAIQWKIANMATELDAAWLLTVCAAALRDQSKPFTFEAAKAKLYSAQAAMRACNEAVQIHGGYGYTREFPLERALRDAKLCEIGEGTNEIQRLVLSRAISQRFSRA